MSDSRIPTLEDRLNEVRYALALGELVTSALAHVDDLCMDGEAEAAAFAHLSRIFSDAMRAHRSSRAVITNKEIFRPAPEVK